MHMYVYMIMYFETRSQYEKHAENPLSDYLSCSYAKIYRHFQFPSITR